MEHWDKASNLRKNTILDLAGFLAKGHKTDYSFVRTGEDVTLTKKSFKNIIIMRGIPPVVIPAGLVVNYEN